MRNETFKTGEIKMIDPTTIDGMNINEETRDYIGQHGEMVGEVVVYVAYVNGQEIGAFETEDEAAENLMYHYRGE
jgi:hypothetical protein